MPIYTPEGRITAPQVVQSRGRDVAAQQDGFNSVARGLSDVATNADRAADEQANIYAAKAISDAKSQWTRAALERQESAEGDAAGFSQSLGSDFKRYADEAIDAAPPRAKAKMRMAFNDYENQLRTNGMAFEATKRVAYRGDLLGATIEQNRNTLLTDPAQFEDLLADTLDAIDGMGLPEDKARAFEDAAREGMAKSAMSALIESDPKGAFDALNSGDWDGFLDPEDKGRLLSVAKAKADAVFVSERSQEINDQMGGEYFGDAADLLRDFEGFRSGTYYDVNHDRLGYGSDTITTRDGRVLKVKKGDVVSREDAERDLARRIKEETRQARDDVGPAWDVLPPSAKAALISVAYNYGSLPKDVVAAIRTGDTLKVAYAVDQLAGHNKGVNAKRRRKEAAIIRGSDPSAIMNDNLAQVEDPVLRGKIARETASLYALDEQARERQRAAADLERSQRVAELEVGISQGSASYGDIEEAYAAGDLTPDQWSTLTRRKDSAVAAAEKAAEKLNKAVARVEAGGLTPFSADDRAAVDLIFDNSDRTPEGGLSLTARTGIAPSEYLATIKGGLADGDVEAYQTASMLQDVAPNVYANDKGTQKKVTEFRGFTSLGYSPEDAVRRVNRTQDEKKAFAVLDPEINKEIGKISLADAGGNGWFTDVEDANAASYMADFNAIYAENRRDGLAPNESLSVAREQIMRVWGVSNVTGSKEIVRHPPERYYPADMNGHEYIGEQAKADAVDVSDSGVSSVRLMADYVTESDIRAGKPPRYRLFYIDEHGIAQAAPGHFQPVPNDDATRAARKDEFTSRHQRKLKIRQDILEQPMP